MIIAAFFLGLAFSIPLGPLGQIMLKRAMNRGFWHGFSIALFDAMACFAFSVVFLIGMEQLALNPIVKLTAQIAGLLFLLFMGIREIFFSPQRKSVKKEFSLSRGMVIGNLFLVLGYYVSNPTIWAFWINFSAFINETIIVQQNLVNYILFSALYALGVLTCQYLAILLFKNIGRFEKAKTAIKFASSGAIIITISYFFYLTIQDLTAHWYTIEQVFH